MKYLALCFILHACVTTQDTVFLEEGNTLALKGLYREAISSYRKSLSKNPDKLLAHNRLGTLLLKVGNYPGAIAHLDRSLPYFKDHFETNFFLGEAHRITDDHAKAIFYYEQADRIKRNDYRVLRALAWTFFEIKYFSKALELAESAYSHNPKDEQTAIVLLRTQIKLKKLSDAQTLIKTFDWSQENTPTVQSVQGDFFLEMGDIAQAALMYKKALQTKPLLASALLGLGTCYLRQANFQQAIRYLEQGQRLRPNNAYTYLQLGKAYEQLQSPKARNSYQTFLEKASADPEYLSLLPAVQQKIATWRD
ncbi:MAG: tetratricopeptide repeat protein [Deltaproteobacteria bacterium]|nr:tetratricopeptide repeat protein [Deltaproteobacteria bacterium]